MELIEHPPILRVPHIPDQVLYMWIVMAVLVGVSIVATRRLPLVPPGTPNMMEVILEQFVKPLMFVIEIISHCARPMSLSLRLFGNMMAGHILLAIFFFMMGLDGMLGWALSGSMGGILIGAPATLIMVVFVVGFLLPLKILVALIQTFIFCKLAMLYIAAAVEETEHH